VKGTATNPVVYPKKKSKKFIVGTSGGVGGTHIIGPDGGI